MNFEELITQNNWEQYPIGLSGCRTSDSSLDVCDYNVTVFDDKSQPEKIIEYKNNFVKIHHAKISESKTNQLIQYDNMQIIQDESWDLRMLLSKVQEKRSILYKDYAKNSLIESIFCCEKTKQAINDLNVFAPCWQKCAAFFLAEGILSLNQIKPSPTHMLDLMRKLEKNPINEKISIVSETVGIERATPSLLERMLKSTIGFSEIVEKNNLPLIIQQKHDYFLSNSMLSDCYFYLGCINKENFVKFKNSVDKNPDLIHILKVAFDIDVDSNLLHQHAELVQQSSNEILESISRR